MRAVHAVAACLLMCAPLSARAQAIDVNEVADDMFRVDGSLRDWSRVHLASLGGGRDAAMRYAVEVAPHGLFIAASITDEHLVRTRGVSREQDAVVLSLALPEHSGRRSTSDVWLFAGISERSVSAAAAVGPSGVEPRENSDVRVVEQSHQDGSGYDLEAFVPWTVLGPNPDWRDARARIRYQDVDREASPRVEDVIASCPDGSPDELPALHILNATRASLATFLADHEIEAARPRFSLHGDVAADSREEHVYVVDRFVAVLGEGYRDGSGYAFMSLPVENASDVISATLADLTGDGKSELALRYRVRQSGGSSDVWEVIVLSGDALERRLGIEVRQERGGAFVEARVDIQRQGAGAPNIVVTASSSVPSGWQPAPPSTDVQPLVEADGPVLGRTYHWDGQRFAKIAERMNPAATAPQPSGGAQTHGGQPAVSAAPEIELPGVAQFLDAFRREAGVPDGTRARFDLHANMGEDGRPERVVVFGRSAFVFGPGFRGGTGYARYDAAVQEPADLLDVRAADVTGDGLAELLVRVRQLLGDVTREVLLVARLDQGRFARVLAVEVSRAQGDRRVDSEVRASGGVLEIAPGRARGWAADTWSFAPESAASGIDPLLLPWRDRAVRYRWVGGRLVR